MNEESIFIEALQKESSTERAAFLDAACAGNAELRRSIELLLRAHEKAGPFLRDVREAGTTRDATVQEGPGMVFGPYKLLELIGEGGMGTVWMAQQTEPVKRLVALKLIKAGMDSKQVLARFEAERLALALMDHPNIARVLDAGRTDAGRPYFVMELVKGIPITRYCDENRLTPKQRLELFVPVCQAVQHAHQKGIIHRDLKPSNVLIALYDGRPVPKVIDFGVAKAAGQPLTEHTLVTGFGAVVGTLEYMSPEQAELNQLDIDTRSDIYSLGVMLYELLTGTTPLNKKRLKEAALLEVLRLIREEEPPRPSTRLSSTAEMPSIAANRGLEPKKLSGLVRGELDWIVMKALEKDRSRRYETANSFAMDVQRYLAGEPVLAAPASQWYRLRKFARRNRGPVAAAGLVLLTLLCGMAGTAWGLLAAEAKKREAEDALKAEKTARADETKARQQAFAALRSMTADVVERRFAQGTQLTEEDRVFLRGVIAQYDAFAAINAEDAESRAARAEGRFRVGKLRHRLGEFQEAEQAFDRALTIRQHLAADFPSRPDFRHDLAQSHLYRGQLFVAVERRKEAEQDFDEALRLLKSLAAELPLRPEFRQDLALSLNDRGILLRYTGRMKEAEQDFEQALALCRQLAATFPLPEFREDLARSHNSRGNLLLETGRVKEAEKHYDDALRIRKQLTAEFPDRPELRLGLSYSHVNRGDLRHITGRLEKAEQDYDQALRIQKQLAADFPYRPEFRGALALSYSNRGELLLAAGRLQQAEQDCSQALSIRKQLVADFPTRPLFRKELASSEIILGRLFARQKRFAEAFTVLNAGLARGMELAQADPEHLSYTNLLSYSHAYRGSALVQSGQPSQAATDLRRALELFAKEPSPDTDQRFERSHVLALLAGLGGKTNSGVTPTEAAAFADQAVAALRDTVRSGWGMIGELKEPDFDALRGRDDFKKLIAEREREAK